MNRSQHELPSAFRAEKRLAWLAAGLVVTWHLVNLLSSGIDLHSQVGLILLGAIGAFCVTGVFFSWGLTIPFAIYGALFISPLLAPAIDLTGGDDANRMLFWLVIGGGIGLFCDLERRAGPKLDSAGA